MAGGLGRRLKIGCGGLVLVVVGLAVVAVAGEVYHLQVPVFLALGWIAYLRRVLPRVRVDWPAIGLFVGVLAVVLTAGHGSLAWLCARMVPPRRWTRRDTGVLLGGTLLLFLTSMAMSGIAHQVGWLMRPGEPLVRSSWEDLQATERLLGVCNGLRPRPAGGPTFALADLPIGHPEFHVVPLKSDGDRVGEFLVYPRDPDAMRRLGGLMCAPGPGSRAVDAAGAAAALAELRRAR